jgi:geranylgeranyl diphosphate synthase type II
LSLETGPLAPYLKAIEEALKAAAHSGTGSLDRLALKHLTRPGRRFRPLLTLLACEAYAGSYEPAIPIALAYEYAHAAALIQDDILDLGRLRRGEPTLQLARGVGTALLAADWLLFSVADWFARYVATKPPVERVEALLHLLAKAGRASAQGEFLDVERGGQLKATIQEYLEVVRLKTGALVAAAAAAGGIVAGAPRSGVDALYRFGEALGVAYQIRDDLADFLLDGDVSGKGAFNDLRNRRLNYVVLLLLERGGRGVGDLLEGVLGREPTSREAARLRELVRDLQVTEEARGLVRHLVEDARHHLAEVPDSQAKELLAYLASLLTTRL